MQWFHLSAAPLPVTNVVGMGWVEGIALAPLVFIFIAPSLQTMDAAFEEAARASGAPSGTSSRRSHCRSDAGARRRCDLHLDQRDRRIRRSGGHRALQSHLHVQHVPLHERVSGRRFPRLQHDVGRRRLDDRIRAIDELGVRERSCGAPAVIRSSPARHTGRPALNSGGGGLPRGLRGTSMRSSSGAAVSADPGIALLPYPQPLTFEALSHASLTIRAHPMGSRRARARPHAANRGRRAGRGRRAELLLLVDRLAHGLPGRFIFDSIAFLPHAVPGVLFGVAATLRGAVRPSAVLPIYGTVAMIMIVYSIAWISFGTRMVNASLIQIHQELDEAGRMSGASSGPDRAVSSRSRCCAAPCRGCGSLPSCCVCAN